MYKRKVWAPVYDGEDDVITEYEGQLTKIADQNSPEYKKTYRILAGLKVERDFREGKLFNQDKVNSMLAADKKKHQETLQNTLNELNALKGKASLTASERAELEQKIEQTQAELKTKEELAAEAQEKLRKNHKKEVDGLTGERDSWKGRFTKSVISRSIMEAATKSGQKAINPRQVMALIEPLTMLVEDLDEKGKPTGEYVPKVTWKDADKDGKPMTLVLTPDEVVKRMSEMEDYYNLFEDAGTGGFNKSRRMSSTETDVSKLAKDPKSYREARKAGIIQ
jgi:hypothetical protein